MCWVLTGQELSPWLLRYHPIATPPQDRPVDARIRAVAVVEGCSHVKVITKEARQLQFSVLVLLSMAQMLHPRAAAGTTTAQRVMSITAIASPHAFRIAVFRCSQAAISDGCGECVEAVNDSHVICRSYASSYTHTICFFRSSLVHCRRLVPRVRASAS